MMSSSDDHTAAMMLMMSQQTYRCAIYINGSCEAIEKARNSRAIPYAMVGSDCLIVVDLVIE